MVYFTYEIYVYIAEYMVFEMRYALTFNKFTVNRVVYLSQHYFFLHTITQKSYREA